ncbi:MAG: SH3 domain-containing protein [Trichodesmium sp. St11_bin5]|nr:SH3 domain-containing protein [Trichodesmium sp. St11_bin5]
MRQTVTLLVLTLMIVVNFAKKATTTIKTDQVSEETVQVSPEISHVFPETTESSEDTASLCRQVNDPAGLKVQKRPTPNSPIVGSVYPDQEVKLIKGYRKIRGPAGRTWVQITSPIVGFVSKGFPGNETNLRECFEVAEETSGEFSGQNTSGDNLQTQTSPNSPYPPETDESLCREIDRKKAPRGLAVRGDASRRSEYRGKVPVDSQLILVDNYQLIGDKNGEKRKWVKIIYPLQGFVSAGNLLECR